MAGMRALENRPYLVDISTSGQDLRLIVREKEKNIPDISDTFRRDDLPAVSLQAVEPTIGDIFIVLADAAAREQL